ncbi:YciI family protein [Streptomyces cyaneus]|uniref:YciI family protein n=1 Tax=Streptomyces cyaneus TaxID=1904 RepID=UPI000FF8A669|nr:YciI family protein [Streptomyces cyaneus]
MKYYLLAMHQPVGDPPPPEILDPIMKDLAAVREEMEAAGVWVFGGGLHGPEASTVVRMRDGEVLTTDGPYAEGKEHLGGFTVIKVPDLDAALMWARKKAEAVRLLPIEVRPFQGEAEDG